MAVSSGFIDDSIDYGEDTDPPPRAQLKVPNGDIYEASRAGDIERMSFILEEGGIDINARDRWDSVPLYYACLAGHSSAVRKLLEAGAICNEHTFDGDRCHYAALTLRIRKILKSYEARPPPMSPLHSSLKSALDNPDSWPDTTFHLAQDSRAIRCHRSILAARSPYFRAAFAGKWQSKSEIRFSNPNLTYNGLYALLHFFYCDRMDVYVDDLDALATICKVTKCESLFQLVERELQRETHSIHKRVRSLDQSEETKRRWILQGASLPAKDRLEEAMCQLAASWHADNENPLRHHADVEFVVGDERFRSHRWILAARSDYFKALFDRTGSFLEGHLAGRSEGSDVLTSEVQDLSPGAFRKLLEYVYTDKIGTACVFEAEEVFEASSRYLLFPLKRAMADALIPILRDTATPEELCDWLLVAEFYQVWKLREFCLDAIAANFKEFELMPEFVEMLKKLPPPSGDSSNRTTTPSAPGAKMDHLGLNVLDDLREKWLEIEGAKLGARDESAKEFDRRLVLLSMSDSEFKE